MPDVVCRKMHLDSILAKGTLWKEHNTGVVHEDIDCWYVGPRKELGSCRTNGLLAGEIDLKRTVVHTGKLRLEGIDALLDLGWAATCDDEVGRRLRGLYMHWLLCETQV